MIIVWKIPCIDNNTYQKVKLTSYDAQGEHVSEGWAKKIFDRVVYVDTNRLSERDRIAVDIANARYDRLNDASFFHSLRHLFVACDSGAFKMGPGFKTFTDLSYHEDQDGNPITMEQFVASMSVSPKQKEFQNCKILHPFSTQGMDVSLLTPMRVEQFNFSEEQIAILTQFVNYHLKLSRCSALVCPSPVVLECDGSGCKIVLNITDEEYNSSLMEFRNLYNDGEPASFCNVVNILSDETIVKHPVVNYIKMCKQEFERLRDGAPDNARPFSKYVGAEVPFEPELVTGYKLIRWLLYTGRLHQPNRRNFQERDSILRCIPNEAVVEIIAFNMFLNMAFCIMNVGSWCMRILNVLGKANFDVPPRRVPKMEEDFYRYVWEQRLKMANVIWQEKGRPSEGPWPHCREAWLEILRLLPFDVEVLQALKLLDSF